MKTILKIQFQNAPEVTTQTMKLNLHHAHPVPLVTTREYKLTLPVVNVHRDGQQHPQQRRPTLIVVS